MSNPIRIERDTFIVNWHADIPGWCTTTIDPATDSWAVRSDGVQVIDYGVVSTQAQVGTLAAGLASAIGVHISGPEPTLGGDSEQFSLYAVQVVATSEDPDIGCVLFVGESPASITNDAAGNTVSDVRLIGVHSGNTNDSGGLERELIVAVKENTADRALCFGVAAFVGAAGTAVPNYTIFNLCVRRLLGNKPLILDPTKL